MPPVQQPTNQNTGLNQSAPATNTAPTVEYNSVTQVGQSDINNPTQSVAMPGVNQMPKNGPVAPEIVPQPKKKQSSAQDTLLISEIRDGMAIMRDGSLRAVVLCQSINFDLMSPQEREGVEYGYQGFLNSLFFPIQIFMRSQRIDLGKYIDKLEKIHANQDNVLLSLLMEDYMAYVHYLIEAANIMDKEFYVVVPYYPPMTTQAGLATGVRKLSTLLKPEKNELIIINETDFTKYKQELTQRVQTVLSGLSQIGIQAIPLNTQELIELYYGAYNPQTANNQKLTNVNDLEAPIVEKGRGEAPKPLNGEGVV